MARRMVGRERGRWAAGVGAAALVTILLWSGAPAGHAQQQPPTVALTPTQGEVGSTVSASGDNWQPSGQCGSVIIMFDGQEVARTDPSSTTYAISTSFAVPSGFSPGAHKVSATQEQCTWMQARDVEFTIITFSISPSSGQVGDTITATGTHFEADSAECGDVTISIGRTVVKTVSLGPNSRDFSTTFPIPDVPPGSYTVRASQPGICTYRGSTVGNAGLTVVAPPPTPTPTTPPPTTPPPTTPPPTTTSPSATPTTATPTTPKPTPTEPSPTPTVGATGTPPVATNDSIDAGAGTSVDIDVLANDVDVDDDLDPSSLTVTEPPLVGTVEVIEGGLLRYSSPSEASRAAEVIEGGLLRYSSPSDAPGPDSFDYRVCDTQAHCDEATVTVRVAAVSTPAEEETEDDCTGQELTVESLTVEPPQGEPGTPVVIRVTFGLPDPECLAGLGEFGLTFNGEAIGDPFDPDDGSADHEWLIPEGLEAGSYTIGLASVADATNLTEAPFEVIGFTSTSSPWQGIVPAVVAIGAAGAGTALVRRRRRERIPPDACSGLRKQVEEAEREVEEAREASDEANQQVEDGRRDLAAGRRELEQCQQKRSGGLRTPLVGGFTRRQREEDEPSEYLLAGHNGTRRTGTPRGIVLHAAPRYAGRSAREVARLLPPGRAAHIAVDAEGVVPLLPDHALARHIEGFDQDTLGAVIVGFGSDPERDETILRNLGRWLGRWGRDWALPARHVEYAAWVEGDEGVFGAWEASGRRGIWDSEPALDLPWERLPELTDTDPNRARSPRLLAAPSPRRGQDDPCAELRSRLDGSREELQRRAEVARQARGKAKGADRKLEKLRRELFDCECRDLPPAADLSKEEEEKQEKNSHWYLLEHQNPSAPMRPNGKSGWYRPVRTARIRGIVVHTAEALDATGDDSSAEGVARYFTTITRPASAHVAVDADSSVPLLPDTAVAFHAKGGNSEGLGIEICYEAHRWGTNPVHEELLLRRSAAWCGLKAKLYGVPVRRLTAAEWAAGERGFIAHADLDPSRRTDPGPNFPWERFLGMVDSIASLGSGSTDPSAPSDPSAPTDPGAPTEPTAPTDPGTHPPT